MPIPFYEHLVQVINGLSTQYLDFPAHLHDRPELVRVQRGTLKMQIYTQEYLLHTGDMAVIFPNVIHSFQTLSEPEDTLIETLVCGQDPNNGFPRKLIGSHIEEPVKPISFFHPDVDYLFTALLAELADPSNTQVINTYFRLLWLRLLPQLTFTQSVQSAASDLTANLLIYINEHFQEPLSLESLSAEFGLCRFYLSRIFTQVLHIGFCDYINGLRINLAKELLRGGRDNILDIAMQCGFNNQQTFNRVFRETCGITPSAYRKKVTGESIPR